MPVTAPVEASTVATPVEPLLHVPPLLPLLLKLIIALTQTDEAPLIVPALGSGLTKMPADADTVPQLVVTV